VNARASTFSTSAGAPEVNTRISSDLDGPALRASAASAVAVQTAAAPIPVMQGMLAGFRCSDRRNRTIALFVELDRLDPQFLEIVGQVLDGLRGAAFAHVDPTIELRQRRERRVLPHRQTVLHRRAARTHNTPKPSRHCRRQAHEAARCKDKLTAAASLPKRRDRDPLTGAVIAIAYERHRYVRIELGRLAVHPDRLAHPYVTRLDRGRRLGDGHHDIEIALREITEHRLGRAAGHVERDGGPAQPEAGELLGDSRAGIIAGDPHTQGLRGAAAGRLEDLVIDRQPSARLIDDEIAVRSQAYARRALVENFISEQGLQTFDLRADGRLGHPE